MSASPADRKRLIQSPFPKLELHAFEIVGALIGPTIVLLGQPATQLDGGGRGSLLARRSPLRSHICRIHAGFWYSYLNESFARADVYGPRNEASEAQPTKSFAG